MWRGRPFLLRLRPGAGTRTRVFGAEVGRYGWASGEQTGLAGCAAGRERTSEASPWTDPRAGTEKPGAGESRGGGLRGRAAPHGNAFSPPPRHIPLLIQAS